MYANKLEHQRRRFVQVRGAIAWLVLMVAWSFYPEIQRNNYQPSIANSTVGTQEVVISAPRQESQPVLRQEANALPGIAEALEDALAELRAEPRAEPWAEPRAEEDR